MLMTFAPDGSVQFTRNPQLLELVDGLGRLAIERMTDIKFDDHLQAFFIRFLTGPNKGNSLRWGVPGAVAGHDFAQLWQTFATTHSAALVRENTLPFDSHKWYSRMVYFPTYEKAVAVEIAFVDFLREQGVAVV